MKIILFEFYLHFALNAGIDLLISFSSSSSSSLQGQRQ
jgi:hypothetical protein